MWCGDNLSLQVKTQERPFRLKLEAAVTVHCALHMSKPLLNCRMHIPIKRYFSLALQDFAVVRMLTGVLSQRMFRYNARVGHINLRRTLRKRRRYSCGDLSCQVHESKAETVVAAAQHEGVARHFPDKGAFFLI